MNFFSSTKKNRNVQRANVVSQLANSILSTASPLAAIPAKIAQAVVSGLSLAEDMKPQEKILNALQGILAASEAALSIAIFTQNEDCKESKAHLCNALVVVGVVYQGVLMAHLSVAELKKEEGNQDSPRNV